MASSSLIHCEGTISPRSGFSISGHETGFGQIQLQSAGNSSFERRVRVNLEGFESINLRGGESIT